MDSQNINESHKESGYPVNLFVEYPEKSSRLLSFFTLLLMIPKAIMLVPHLILLYLLEIARFVAAIFAQFAVLFTGRYPRGIFDFVVGVYRWQMRINSFMLGLADKYPPFSLKE